MESGARTGENLVMNLLADKVQAQGGTIHYKTVAQYLEREDDNTGRVTSVVALDPDGNYVRYVGRKAVVMATGDFSANQDMMAKYCGWVAPLLQYNEIDYDAAFQFGGLGGGDGQKMGLWVGAAWQRCQPNAPMIDAVGPMPYRQSIADFSGLLLNKKGERYSNEDTIFSYGTYAMMMQPDMTRYGIWDSAYATWFPQWETFGATIVENEGKNFFTPEQYKEQWDANVENGTFVKGDTVEEVLAQLEGLDAEQAAQSVARYNELCAAGYDEDFHKEATLLAPIAEALLRVQAHHGARQLPVCDRRPAHQREDAGLRGGRHPHRGPVQPRYHGGRFLRQLLQLCHLRPQPGHELHHAALPAG